METEISVTVIFLTVFVIALVVANIFSFRAGMKRGYFSGYTDAWVKIGKAPAQINIKGKLYPVPTEVYKDNQRILEELYNAKTLIELLRSTYGDKPFEMLNTKK
jgi:hypothetical protein